MIRSAVGGRIDPPQLPDGIIPPWHGAGCMIPARHADRHSTDLAAINSPAATEQGAQHVRSYATGGLIPMPVDAPPPSVHLAPDECLVAWRGDKWRCIRLDHRHDTDGIISCTSLDGALHALNRGPTDDDVEPVDHR